MRIAVVGAGLAGLTAARTLSESGHDVVVFEKSRGPGGRLSTRRVTDVPHQSGPLHLSFDHGAQYFTVADPRFALEVNDWEGRELVARWHGRVVSVVDGELAPVSSRVARFVGVPGMSTIGRHLADRLDVRYETRIESLASLHDFDRVIVAVPAPQAAALVGASASLAATVAGAVMAPCWAVMVAFESAVAAEFDAAFVSDSPLSWSCRNRSKPERGAHETWVLHASSEWTLAHLEDDAASVVPELLRAFRDVVHVELPGTLYSVAHRWRFALPDPPLTVGALKDESGRVLVCGDWCAGSRAESAYLSGLVAAASID